MLRNDPCKCCSAMGLFLVIAVLAGGLPVQAAVHLKDASGPGGQRLGHSISALGDANADGRGEFLVGAPGDNRPGTEAGKVYFWFGGSAVTEAAARQYDGAAGDWFGYDVAAIGDVNGDGREDWAAGAPYADAGATEAGRVYVFFGALNPPASGLASLRADLIINGAAAGDHFGHCLAAAGDFNGDGKDDFIVGAPFSNLRAGDAGAAYIIYGGSGGPSNDLADATVLTGQGFEDYFGWSVSGAGNFLGHPEKSVAVGAPSNNTHGGLNAGAVYVFEGTLNGAQPDTTIDFAAGVSSLSKAGSQYGFSVSNAGRWNSDGYDDLVVGAPYCDAGATDNGRIEIIYGGTSPDSQGDKYVNGESAADHFGYAVARGYDLAGSSADDVLVGAPHHNGGSNNSGRAYIYEGGSSATGAGSLTILGTDPLNPDNPADDLYGFDVASAGDFDGDGLWDLAVSAPAGNLVNNAVAGFCRIQDSSGLAVPAFVSRWEATWSLEGGIDLFLDIAMDPASVQWVQVSRQMVSGNGGLRSETVIFDGPLGFSGDGFFFDQTGYRLQDVGATSDLEQAAELSYGVVFSLSNGTSVALDGLAGPEGAPNFSRVVSLSAAWPNPSNPGTTLEFVAPRGDAVLCQVFDIRGNQVCCLFDGAATGSTQNLFWDGRTSSGAAAASGLYLVQLVSPGSVLSRRVVLTR